MNSIRFDLPAVTDLEEAKRQALIHLKQFLGDVQPVEVSIVVEPTELFGVRSLRSEKWDVDVVAYW